MPITVFDIKGIAGHRRERIEVAVVAGGKHTKAPHEAWIAADPFNGLFRMLTGVDTTVAVRRPFHCRSRVLRRHR
jgi:hypothetical protein